MEKDLSSLRIIPSGVWSCGVPGFLPPRTIRAAFALCMSLTHGTVCRFVIFATLALISGYGDASEFGAIASFTTNYFYRGYSKSGNRPALRGNVDYEHDSGLYAGSWLSWVDLGDDGFPGHSDIEFYPYLGYSMEVMGDGRLDLAVARYIYNDKVFGLYSDEYSLAVHFRDSATARFGYADDAYHRGHAMLNYDLSGRYPLTDALEFSAGLGYNDASAVLEYNSIYWHGGLTWYWNRLALDFRYVDYKHLDSANPWAPNLLLLEDVNPKFVFSLSIGY